MIFAHPCQLLLSFALLQTATCQQPLPIPVETSAMPLRPHILSWLSPSSVPEPPMSERAEAAAFIDQTKRAEAEAAPFIEHAKSLVPFVETAQVALLQKYNEDWEKDKAAWKITTQRFGDFLMIQMTRRDYRGNLVSTTMAIRLDDASTIRIKEGNVPDRMSTLVFSAPQVKYDDDEKDRYVRQLYFPDVELPDPSGKPIKARARISISSLYDNWSSTSNIWSNLLSVDHCARKATDDKIIFGQGGSSEYEDSMQRYRSATYSGQLEEYQAKLQRPGATLNVPGGLGHAVFQQIMEAMAAKATTP